MDQGAVKSDFLKSVFILIFFFWGGGHSFRWPVDGIFFPSGIKNGDKETSTIPQEKQNEKNKKTK